MNYFLNMCAIYINDEQIDYCKEYSISSRSFTSVSRLPIENNRSISEVISVVDQILQYFTSISSYSETRANCRRRSDTAPYHSYLITF